MRFVAMMIALAFFLAGCGSDRSRVAAQTWAAADGGSDMSGAAASAQTPTVLVLAPTSTEPADADELAGGAECVTRDGAPYEAPTC